jgi:hypothetical protein
MMRRGLRRRRSLSRLSTIAQAICIAVLLYVGRVECQRVASTVVLSAILTAILAVVGAVLAVVAALVLSVGLGVDNTSCKQRRQDRSETHGDDLLRVRGRLESNV